MSRDSSSPSSAADRQAAPDRFPVRARQLLRVRSVWAFPLVAGVVVATLMTVFYVGSVVDPLAHLNGLPVAVVNQDRALAAGSRTAGFGQQVQQGLRASPAVSGRLRLVVTSLPAAEKLMDRDGAYTAVVIPPGFTSSLLTVSGQHVAGGTAGKPRVEILTNQRAGTTGASLATGVLQPALGRVSQRIGQQLTARAPASGPAAANRAFLADPVTVTAVQYRPLPSNSALGLSAFYIGLLTMLAGFLVGLIVQSSVDVALGYASSEVGPRWDHRQPVPITRWQTLIIKWVVCGVLTAVLTAVILALAAGALGMDAPNAGLLWLDMWLCAASVAAGTIALLAVLGAPGQLAALLLFVYAGLASAGVTVPVEALPGVFRTLSEVLPLRQIVAGTRAILYFGARGDAGLTRGLLAAGLGLLFWLIAGAAIVRWYDRKQLYRIQPGLLAYIRRAFQDYRAQRG